jgi:hypothetical protein
LRNVIPILLSAILLCSCQRGKQQADTRQSITFEAARSNFFNGLVNPSEVARELQAAYHEFHAELMADPKMYSHYAANEVTAAANLGIYLSDLNYSVAYSQTELTKDYFEAAYELSRAAGIEKGVLEFLNTRYHENLSKNDSVKAVVNDLLAKSTRGFQGTQRERMAGIAMAAYQIENLHFALALVQLHPEAQSNPEKSLSVMILNQRRNVETIYNFLKAYSDPLDPNKNPNYPYYANALLELLEVYRKVDEGVDKNINGELNEKVNAIRAMILKIG